jgi:hypothetical protein
MLCLLLVGKRKKRKEKNKPKREVTRDFFPKTRGQTHLAGCARRDFCGY